MPEILKVPFVPEAPHEGADLSPVMSLLDALQVHKLGIAFQVGGNRFDVKVCACVVIKITLWKIDDDIIRVIFKKKLKIDVTEINFVIY